MVIERTRIITDDPTKLGIEIDFKKGVGDPSRVFRAMSDLINALQRLDKGLIGTVDTKLEPILLLEDVEAGSVRSWLKQKIDSLEGDPRQTQEQKTAIESYLVKCKFFLVDFINKVTEITDVQQIATLEEKILKAAEETGAKQIPVYVPPSRRQILQGMVEIGEAVSPLRNEDKAEFLSAQGNTEINKTFHMAPEQIEDLLTSEIMKTEIPMIMKVKKPDFLGESKWEFKWDKIIEVKMGDTEWLAKYQAGRIDVLPGDAIRANVRITVKYGLDHEMISTQYEALNVLEVIRNRKVDTEQSSLFNG